MFGLFLKKNSLKLLPLILITIVSLTFFAPALVVPLIVIIALAILVMRDKLPLIELLGVISGAVTGSIIELSVYPELPYGLTQNGALIGSTVMVVVLITAHVIKKLFSKERVSVY